MISFRLLLILKLVILIQSQATYYVLPTNPHLNNCTGNNSCSSGEICQTLNDYAKNSSQFFIPNKMSSISLKFMCGLHRFTEQLDVHNISTIILQGMSTARNTVIQMPADVTLNQFSLIFSNITTLRIRNITLYYPLMSVTDVSTTRVENVQCYGNENATSWYGVSSNLTFVRSQAAICKSSFQFTCLVRVTLGSTLTVVDSEFMSFHHQGRSCLYANESTVTLSGNVTFFNNSLTFGNTCGPAIYLTYSAIMNITKDATVLFLGNKVGNASLHGDGGAVYIMHISRVYISGNVKFMNNQANGRGGAITLEKYVRMDIIENANVSFINNTSSSGGAVSIYYGNMTVTNSTVTFVNNVATQWGGAIHIFNSNLFITTLANLKFNDN